VDTEQAGMESGMGGGEGSKGGKGGDGGDGRDGGGEGGEIGTWQWSPSKPVAVVQSHVYPFFS